MTELEKQIVDNLFQQNLVKFYVQFVDDTLVLAKPNDFDAIQNQLNSFHSQLKFTRDEYVNDVHFLDILVKSDSTTVFRKSSHTGQYVYNDSWEGWFTKTAWVRSLVSRAFKICSNTQVLNSEVQNIKCFMSWNGNCKSSCNKLIKAFTPVYGPKQQPPQITRIFMTLPYIGKEGEIIARKCSKRIRAWLTKPVKFQFHWQTTKVASFTGTKDPISKESGSSVVYKFVCPGCNASYIGKTDRNLITRVK
jgi:hypothetical protein